MFIHRPLGVGHQTLLEWAVSDIHGARESSDTKTQPRFCVHAVLSARRALSCLVDQYLARDAISHCRDAPQDAQDVMAHIRWTVSSLYSAGEAADVPILYGGSVTADNVADFIRQEDVNGALVGGASLKAGGFVDLVRNAGAASG